MSKTPSILHRLQTFGYLNKLNVYNHTHIHNMYINIHEPRMFTFRIFVLFIFLCALPSECLQRDLVQTFLEEKMESKKNGR